MSFILTQKIMRLITGWLLRDVLPPRTFRLSDFERIRYEIRPCDVLLIEGRSRVSEVIRIITQSPWTHAALYIGRIHDIEDPSLREKIAQYYQGDPSDQLLIESIMGKGTVVSPITAYRQEHIRVCRPSGLSRHDAQKIITYAINRIGVAYDIRQILDLARFLFPWHLWPRRWRSSLFKRNVGTPTHDSCSSLIAEAFSSVNFPILPLLRQHEETGIELIQRNTRLYTPSDFDYSPFFEIMKYPVFGLDSSAPYRDLPWNKTGIISDDNGKFYTPEPQPAAETKITTINTETETTASVPEKTAAETDENAAEIVNLKAIPQQPKKKRIQKSISRIKDFFD